MDKLITLEPFTHYDEKIKGILRDIDDKVAAVAADVASLPRNNATASNDGYMSAEDKSKLDGIAAGATANTIDTTLSASSTNAVQNKVITAALNDIPHYTVISSRTRDPSKPNYGLGGGGDEAVSVILESDTYTGNAEVTLILDGNEYDGKNISQSEDSAPDNTLIITKKEI